MELKDISLDPEAEKIIFPTVLIGEAAAPPRDPDSLPEPPAFNVESILAGHLSHESRKAYRSDLRHFLAHIGLTDPYDILTTLKGIDRGAAIAYRDAMLIEDKLSAATVSRRLATLNILFATLKDEGWLARNPFTGIKRPKVASVGKTPALSREQVERILAQPDVSTAMGWRDRMMLLLMFFCGLRRSEVVMVRREDFYVHQGYPMFRVLGKGRSDKSDSVKVPEAIWPELREYAASVRDYLFTTGDGERPISASRVYVMFKKYCRLAGLDASAFSPHSTRSTFITLCLEGGADVRSVMYAARHANPATTIRYDRQRMNIINHATNFLKLDSGRPGENH